MGRGNSANAVFVVPKDAWAEVAMLQGQVAEYDKTIALADKRTEPARAGRQTSVKLWLNKAFDLLVERNRMPNCEGFLLPMTRLDRDEYGNPRYAVCEFDAEWARSLLEAHGMDDATWEFPRLPYALGVGPPFIPVPVSHVFDQYTNWRTYDYGEAKGKPCVLVKADFWANQLVMRRFAKEWMVYHAQLVQDATGKLDLTPRVHVGRELSRQKAVDHVRNIFIQKPPHGKPKTVPRGFVEWPAQAGIGNIFLP